METFLTQNGTGGWNRSLTKNTKNGMDGSSTKNKRNGTRMELLKRNNANGMILLKALVLERNGTISKKSERTHGPIYSFSPVDWVKTI